MELVESVLTNTEDKESEGDEDVPRKRRKIDNEEDNRQQEVTTPKNDPLFLDLNDKKYAEDFTQLKKIALVILAKILPVPIFVIC